MYKLILDGNKPESKVIKPFTPEEEENRIKEQMNVEYSYQKITEEQELIALQTLEIEDLKDEIQNIKNNIGGM